VFLTVLREIPSVLGSGQERSERTKNRRPIIEFGKSVRLNLKAASFIPKSGNPIVDQMRAQVFLPLPKILNMTMTLVLGISFIHLSCTADGVVLVRALYERTSKI
jgi:hypothetical protein